MAETYYLKPRNRKHKKRHHKDTKQKGVILGRQELWRRRNRVAAFKSRKNRPW